MARKKIPTTVYITPEQDRELKVLHAKTKVPVAEYIRQGIDLVLRENREHLPGQLDLYRDAVEVSSLSWEGLRKAATQKHS